MTKKDLNEMGSTPKKILAVATREFASNGFSGARMDRIAKLAKCNIRMLYHYFSSKEGLYLRVIEESFNLFLEEEDLVEVNLDDPWGSIERFFTFMCVYFAKNQHLDGIIRNENLMEGRFIKQANFAGTRNWLETNLRAIVTAGKSKNIIRDDLDYLNLYLTIAALSRYHISNRYTLSAVVGVDVGSAEWQARRLSEGLSILRSYIAPVARESSVLPPVSG